ncbi:hypothetical protein TELCIR_12628, partial [Teladorsagia circumcincta]
ARIAEKHDYLIAGRSGGLAPDRSAQEYGNRVESAGTRYIDEPEDDIERPWVIRTSSGRLSQSAVDIALFTTYLKPKSPKDTKEEIMKKKAPPGKMDEKPYEDPYLSRHPGGVNLITGEIRGPVGPERSGHGNWERKGRLTNF